MMRVSTLVAVIAMLGLAAGGTPAPGRDVGDLAFEAFKDPGEQAKAIKAGDDSKAAPVANEVPSVAEQPSEAGVAISEAGEEGPPPAKPWSLPEPGVLKKLGIHQYGWVEQGLTFNSLSPTNRWNGPVFTNDRSNEYELNQLWVGWERAVKTNGCGWDIGGRIDLTYGSDWRYGACKGLETNLDAPNQLYGLVMPQFYLEVGYNDLTVKIGHYAACIGYEIVPAPGNFFYSHSYALGYSEPVLVTGFQGDYKVNDNWNLIAGLNEGYNEFQDENGKYHFLGGLKWHNDERKVSVSMMADIGPYVGAVGPAFGPADPLGQNKQYQLTLLLKKQLSEKLSYAFEQVFGGTEENTDPRPFGPYAKWWGMDQYLIYTINPCWSAGARVEWFRDQNGSRVAGLGFLGYAGWPAAPGFAGTFTEVTLGVNWHPNLNIVVRPELRWDAYSGSNNLPPQNQLPFGDGTRSSQFLFATDVIFTF